MWPVDTRTRILLPDSHRIAVTVEALVGTDGSPVDVTPWFVGGSMERARQEIRTSGTLEFADEPVNGASVAGIIPTTPDALLAPYGNQLRVWYALVDHDGTTLAPVPVGTLRITRVAVRAGRVAVDCPDRAWVVQGARLEQPYSIAAGTGIGAAIRALLVACYPQAVYDIGDVAETTPLVVLDAQADPWAALQSLATAAGAQLYFDALGVCVLRPEPDLATVDPIWTFDGRALADGGDGQNLALYDLEHAWDTDGAYNAVVATGEAADDTPPAYGVARDLDRSSPTYYGTADSPGAFGHRPMFYSSPLLLTNAQAALAAAGILQREVGLAESLTIPSLPHPALEPGDPIRVIRSELGVDTVHQVDRITLPLRADGGAQTIQTRVRRVVLGS